MAVMLCATPCALAQTRLNLTECRDMALHNNKQVEINNENKEAAKYMRKAALSNFFPTFSANGAYIHNSRDLYLMPDEAEFPFGTMNADGTFTFNTNLINTYMPVLDDKISDWVARQYLDLREESKISLNNIVVGEVGVKQPIFMGGKIVEMYKMSKVAEEMLDIKSRQQNSEILVSVDEAYWRVISVENKKKVAEKYCDMLRKVDKDLESAIAEGTATRSDQLTVRVKLNEAEINLAKAEDGLVLSKMALCQICGLPLDSEIYLDDFGLGQASTLTNSGYADNAVDNRDEVLLLKDMDKLAKSGVHIAASQLMPTVVAGATYYASMPNLFNGVDDSSMRGSFAAGVVVNIPIANANDICNLKAAKHKARTVELQLEEAQEKIRLQVTQTEQQLAEANRKLSMATANIDNAEENLRMAQAGFEEGMISSTELMGAQTAWLKAYSEKIDASIEVRLYETYLMKNAGRNIQ